MASEVGHMKEDHDEAVKLTAQQLGHGTSSINHRITAEYIVPRDGNMITTENTETAMFNKRLESGSVAPHGAPIPDSDAAPILPGLITTAEINEWLNVNEPANTDRGRDSDTRFQIRDITGRKRVQDLIQAGLALKAKDRAETEEAGGHADTDGGL